MDEMVNNIQLTWKLAWLLKTYRTCNSMVGFSKYLLNDVTLFTITLGVTWTQPYIYIYICIFCLALVVFRLQTCNFINRLIMMVVVN